MDEISRKALLRLFKRSFDLRLFVLNSFSLYPVGWGPYWKSGPINLESLKFLKDVSFLTHHKFIERRE